MTDSSDPVARLEQIREIVERHADPALAGWFRFHAERIIDGDRSPAFGVTAARAARHRRDYWLREAFSLVPGDDPRDRVRRLHVELQRFLHGGQWRRHRFDPEPPAYFSPVRLCLWHAARTGARVDLGPKRLLTICCAEEISCTRNFRNCG